MTRTAHGEAGPSSPPTESPPDVSAFDAAVDAIDAELTVIAGNPDRVEHACAEIQRQRASWSRPAYAQRLGGLARLAEVGSGAAKAPVIALLHDVADAMDDPWPILMELLGSADPYVCQRTLHHLRNIVEGGGVRVDVPVLAALGQLIESGPDPLREPAALESVGWLLRGPPGAPGADAALTALYLESPHHSTRRLAARVLDLAPALPSPRLAERVLGVALAAFVEPYLAYTRATHLDLLDLAAGSDPENLLPSLRDAERLCGEPLLREIVSALGWRSLNCGLAVRQCIGMSAGGSFPLLLKPAEAALLEECPNVNRVFDRFVVVAHGGSDGEPAARSGSDAIDRFRAYNVRHADLLVDLLGVAPLTADKVRRLIEQMDRIVEDFQILFAAQSEEGTAVAGAYRAIKSGIDRELTPGAADRPLSAEATRLVQMFEDPSSPAEIHTLHGCKRYLHQRGLHLGFGLAESSRTTNRTVTLAIASHDRVLQHEQPIDYVDFDTQDGPPPYVVHAAEDAFARHMLHGEQHLPKLRIFCYGNEVHCFAAFKNHPAFIRVDLSPPHRGGMIDLEYFGVSKYELEWHPNVLLPAIEEIFRRADFDVRIENTRIHARYDKERAADFRDLCRKLDDLFGLVPALMDVDWVIGDLDLNDEARRTVAAAWADFFARWGVLPMRHVLTSDRRGILLGVAHEPAGDRELRWPGSGSYRDHLTVDPPSGFWARLRHALEARGLGAIAPFQGERPITQLTLETFVLEPLRRALARGEITETSGAFSPSPLYTGRHEAALLATVLSSDDASVARSARLARLVALLEGRIRFRSSGAVNGYEVQRGPLALAGETVGLYVLRDGGGIPRLALFGTGDTLHERREDAHASPEPNWSMDPDALSVLLRRHNFPAEWVEPYSEAATAQKVRALFAAPNVRTPSAPLPGERVLGGLKASPGRAVGLARVGLSGRQPLDLEGGILIAPALGPRDNPFVFRSAGIVSTGGGILSHAGLLALQFHKPSLVVDGSWQLSNTGVESLAYCCVSQEEIRKHVGGFDVVERHKVAERDERVVEGDLLVLDADEGVLRVIGQEPDALSLHEGLRQLAAASRGLAAARSDPEVLALRGRTLRAVHQLEKLLGRMRDPVLARHAATELLIGEVGTEPAVGHAEKVRLLHAIFANPAAGGAARATVQEMGQRTTARLAALYEQALRLIPTANTAVEVLSYRLDVIRTRNLLANVAGLLDACGLQAPGYPADVGAVDLLAVARLRNLRNRVVAASRHASSRNDDVRLRHVLRHLDRLDTVLGTAPGAREEFDRMRTRLASSDESRLRTLSELRVIGPGDGGIELLPLVGSKAANLAEAERLGEGPLIPRWFVVTDRAFREVLDSAIPDHWDAEGSPAARSLRELIDRTLARTDASDAQKSLAIARAWEAVTLPRGLVADIASAYECLAAAGDGDAAKDDDPAQPFVAVRSSACEEDTEITARAGEFDTFLFVRGLDALCRYLKRAWSGLWTERAIHNRAVLGIAGQVGGGVLLQRMVWARAAGVLHTINLAEGRLREMVINAGLGLGEGIVSGAVAADQAVVSKQESMAISQLRFRYVTNDKRERVIFDARFGSGTTRVETLYHQRLRPALEYVELCELARAAARLEWAFRHPLDIEFAVEGTHLRLLQIRPVPAVFAFWRDTGARHPLIRREP